MDKDRSAIYLHHNVTEGEAIVPEVAMGILGKDFPFTYLGCPIYYKRK